MSLIPEAFVISELLGNETAEVIAGGKSVDAALKAMDDGVTKVMRDSGYYN